MMKRIKQKLLMIIFIIGCILLANMFTANADTKEIIYVAKTYIDYPTGNELGGNIVIEGWVMTNDSDSEIKAYIDGVETKIISQERIERPDVLKAISGYGTTLENPTPGIRLILDTKNLSEGNHNVIINILSRDGNLLTGDSRKFYYVKEKAKMYVDEPLYNKTVIKDGYKFEGWKMSNDANSKVKVLIDNEEQEFKEFEYVQRPDVLRAINGYGSIIENRLPGFEFKLDLSKIVDGEHMIKIQVLSEEGKILSEVNREIVVQKYVAKSYIDYPANDSASGKMLFDAWAISNDEQSTIKIYIDDIEQNAQEIKRIEREDVLQKIIGYGTAKETPLPGINANIDINKLTLGKHKIALKVFSREGKEISQSIRNFEVEEVKAKIYIDTGTKGTNIINKNTLIDGWIMSNDKDANIKVYVDEKEQQILNYTRVERQDVLNAIHGYGNKTENPLPGFNFNIDISKIENGEHILKIDVLSNNGEKIVSQERKIRVEKYRARMDIDSPYVNEIVKKSLKLEGWIMSDTPNADIKVYIDEDEIKDLKIKRKERPDVLKVITGYGTIKENPLPGFETEIDTSKIKDGKHTVKVVAVVNSEVTNYIKTIDFIINKYQTNMYLDEPEQAVYNTDTQLTVRGWVMSELANKKIIVKFDNETIENVDLQEREDVINAIHGYGTREENPKPGFITKLNTQNYTKGKHTITIQVYSYETDEIIKELKKDITLVDKIKRETITYGYSGASLNGRTGGSELRCYKYGDGPNVLFATFCVHGYEDSWDRDGEVLVNIANKFYDKLISDQDYLLASKWTVYLFSEVNPDGRRLGTTKDGPGRTTLYSEVGQGIDINRSWQTGSSYQRYTSKRNYNGTAGFQAYEAKYLRDFMLTHKSTNGQNVVIDLHGWENQLIGDESICKYYKTQYPSCRTSGYGRYGTQYIISWARLNLGAKVALVELPVARNMAEVNNMQLPEKYIDATLNLMRGM